MENLETVTPVSATRAFFNAFDYKLITVSVQHERRPSHMPSGKWLNPKNRVVAVTPDVFHSPEFQKELVNCQLGGFAIYFLINEGDGLPDPDDALKGDFNCGKKTNVKVLKSLCIDTDNADVNALIQKLKEIKLRPHYSVATSPGRFHLYFLIKPIPSEGENVFRWYALQRLLMSLVPKLDQSTAKENQVLRIPGFLNLKGKLDKPFKTYIDQKYNDPLHDLKFLYDRLGAHNYNDPKKELKIILNGSNGHGSFTESYKKYEFPVGKLKEGDRRNGICRFIEHSMENVIPLETPRDEFFISVDGFIIQYLEEKDWKDFLEGGHRRPNLYQYYDNQHNRRVKSKFERDTAVAVKKMDRQVEDASNIKSLKDSFYLNFPGDLGMLVREINSYAPNLSLELCFAGALIISGALKSETFRFKGAWPFVNGLVIAGTGAGKSTLKDIVERTLDSCGLRGKYPQVFGFQNSVQSLHTSLYTAGGSGTVIVDESGDYLQTITSKYAPGYAKAIKKYFKEATTGKDEGTWLHPGGSLAYNVPAIKGGMLSLWMLIQPDKYTSSLDLADMADGFLPRFFTFNGTTNIQLKRFMSEESGTKTFKPSIDLQVYLESLVQLMPAVSVDCILQEAEKDMKEKAPKAKLEVINAAKRDAVYVARSEARKMRNVQVTITDEAQSLVLNYLDEQQKEAEKSYLQNKESDSKLGIFVRMEEMLMRFMCNAVSWNPRTKSAVIDKELAEQSIKFHKFSTDRFFKNELKEIAKGTGEREDEIVMEAIERVTEKTGQAATIKEISQAIRNTKRPKNIKQVLRGLVDSKEVWMFHREHKKHSKINIEVYKIAESEDLIN